MNIFSFIYDDALVAIVVAFATGMFFGFFFGLIRFLMFTAFERKEA